MPLKDKSDEKENKAKEFNQRPNNQKGTDTN
jgi:hypothetical protein